MTEDILTRREIKNNAKQKDDYFPLSPVQGSNSCGLNITIRNEKT